MECELSHASWVNDSLKVSYSRVAGTGPTKLSRLAGCSEPTFAHQNRQSRIRRVQREHC